ncbi:MAG: hypothetical protein R3F37_23545 [Candidatus Competibacteraceae bacterium]
METAASTQSAWWNEGRQRSAVTLGTQWTPFYNNSIGYFDQLNSGRPLLATLGARLIKPSSMTLMAMVTWTRYPWIRKAGIAEFRRGTSLVYTTPDWSGFSGQVMLVMDGEGGKDSVDQWNWALSTPTLDSLSAAAGSVTKFPRMTNTPSL